MVTQETITIDPCPCCGGRHAYDVEVTFSLVATLTRVGPQATRSRTYTRLFTCPVGKGTFQAPIEVDEGDGKVVDDVSVQAPSPDGQ